MTSEDAEEPQATTAASSDASGEGSDPRAPGGQGRQDADDIPLQIAGHEDRTRPGAGDDSTGGSANERNGTPPGGESVLEFSEDDDVGEFGEAGDEDEDEVEPVELLVQLAKDGEIDPWDIDIVAVTDKFLEVLDEADLRTSGRALFYASVLLRMKGDELFAPDEPDDAELPPWEAPFADDDEGQGAFDPEFDPVAGLEAEMERRLERKHARGKPETLDELVRELRDAERGTRWKASRSYDTSDSPSGYGRGVQELSYHSGDDFRVDDEPTANDVTHTAHEEDIESVIDDVDAALTEQYDRGREEVLYAEIEQVGGSRVMTYLSLLFLAHRGRIVLEQDELFGDLWIQRAAPETEVTEAVAD